MSDGADPYDDVIRAAHRFADQTYARLARKIVHAMQRFPASGIFGDQPHRTLWDEYCHERHFGSHDALESAWDATVAPYIDQALASLTPDEHNLLFSLNQVEGDRTASDEVRSALDGFAMARAFPPSSWSSAHG